MDPIFPLYLLAGIAGAAALGWRATRGRLRAAPDPGIVRTQWTLHFGFCRNAERRHRYDSCTMVQDFKRGETECSRCGHSIRAVDPMSQYQVDGNGEGLKLDPEGLLIASLCEGEWSPKGPKHKDYERLPEGRWHAPLFDLDYGAALFADGTLLLEKPGLADRYDQVWRLCAEYGLAETCPTSAAERERSLASKMRYPLQDRPPSGGPYRESETVPQAAIRLTVPARLVPSSTEGHYHLYLETRMCWQDYLRLMRAMADAGLLESGWVEMCARRKMAMLRKPGVRKSPA